jgi:hypothetical protein
MAANATADQLGLDISELEQLLQAEVAAWIEQAAAADAAEDALFSRLRSERQQRWGRPKPKAA